MGDVVGRDGNTQICEKEKRSKRETTYECRVIASLVSYKSKKFEFVVVE